jgi:AcrR family transcriptional regulator
VPRTDEANQRVREAQRGRIFTAATRVFAEKGLAATMAEIAEAAGVSQGLAYRYFASKDELIRAIVAEAMQAAPATPSVQTLVTPGQILETFLTMAIEARRRNREFFQLIHHVASDPETPKDLLRQMLGRGRAFVRTLRQMIVAAQGTGEVADDDPDELVSAVIASMDGLTRLPRNHPDGRKARYPNPQIILRMLKPAAETEET